VAEPNPPVHWTRTCALLCCAKLVHRVQVRAGDRGIGSWLVAASRSTAVPTDFVYDGRGRLTGVSQGSRTTMFDYDARNRLTMTTDTLGRTVGFDYYDPVNFIDPSGLEWIAVVFGENGIAKHEAIVNVGSNGVPGRVYENAAGLSSARQNVPWSKSFAAEHSGWSPLWAKDLGPKFDPTKNSYDTALDPLFDDNTYQCTNYSEWKQKGQPPSGLLNGGQMWRQLLFGRPVLADRNPSSSWFSTMGYNQGYKPASQVIGNWNP
jgi:YD repeat-containing protein